MIHEAYYESPIGLIKIEATDQSIMSLSFADKENAHSSDEMKPAVLNQALAELDEYFNHGWNSHCR